MKFNEALSKNRELREEIENLRQERKVFDEIYKRLEHDLHEKKKEMAAVIEDSNVAYEERLGPFPVTPQFSGVAWRWFSLSKGARRIFGWGTFFVMEADNLLSVLLLLSYLCRDQAQAELVALREQYERENAELDHQFEVELFFF